MSYLLVAEVLDHAPPMTAVERLVLVAIAELCRGSAREWDCPTETLVRRVGVEARAVRAALRRLAERGIEVRVPVTKDRLGAPTYAHRGRVPTYRLPLFDAPAGCRCESCQRFEGGTTVPPSESRKAAPGRPKGARERPKGAREGMEGGTVVPPIPSRATLRVAPGSVSGAATADAAAPEDTTTASRAEVIAAARATLPTGDRRKLSHYYRPRATADPNPAFAGFTVPDVVWQPEPEPDGAGGPGNHGTQPPVDPPPTLPYTPPER